MRNLELELGARRAVRPTHAVLPRLPWTPTVQFAVSLAVLGGLLTTTVALGHGGLAAVAAVFIGLAWLVMGRDGIAVSALLALGSLPYLALVLRLGAGT